MSRLNPRGAPANPPLADEQVADYLRLHRDFLQRHPELIAELMPPAHSGGRSVVDLQHYLIDRLRGDLAALRRAHDETVTAARANISGQQRVHNAVIDLMNAPSFEHFVEAITTDLALTLDIDAVSLCVENALPNQPRTKSGVRFLALGTIDGLMGDGRRSLLRSAIAAEKMLYGPAAPLIKSDALLRLSVGAEAPAGLLALGSRDPEHYRPGQGTELLAFLAKTIESTARAWLDLSD